MWEVTLTDIYFFPEVPSSIQGNTSLMAVHDHVSIFNMRQAGNIKGYNVFQWFKLMATYLPPVSVLGSSAVKWTADTHSPQLFIYTFPRWLVTAQVT